MRRSIIALLLCLLSGEVFAACTGGVCFWVQVTGNGTGNWDNTGTHWSTTSGGAANTGPPGAGDAIVFDGSSCQAGGCTITVTSTCCTGAPAFGDLDMRGFIATGIWTNATNNINMSFARMRFDGSTTPTFHCGSATYTLTNTSGIVFNNGNNHTLDCGSAGITVNTASPVGSRIIDPEAQSLGAVTVGGPTTEAGAYPVTIGTVFASSTIASLTIVGPGAVLFGGGQTTTITGGITLSGGTAAAPILMGAETVNATLGATNKATVSIGTNSTVAGVAFRGFTKSGAGTLTTSDSYDLGLNSGFTITPPAGGGGVSGIIGN